MSGWGNKRMFAKCKYSPWHIATAVLRGLRLIPDNEYTFVYQEIGAIDSQGKPNIFIDLIRQLI